MPRKQRFKPSRKPKPITAIQTEERSELERSSAQHDGMPRASEYDPAQSARDRQSEPLTGEAEAQ